MAISGPSAGQPGAPPTPPAGSPDGAESRHDAPVPQHAAGPPRAPGSTTSTRRRTAVWVVAVIALLLVLAVGGPWLIRAFTTVSTDDAYVNGHVTFVAPRVSGQVASVLVDDNNRVRTGDLLLQLDKEPYEVQVHIAQAAVDAAQADLVAAQAQTRASIGQTRSARFGLDQAINDVNNQIALLSARVATLHAREADLAQAQQQFNHMEKIRETGAISQDEIVQRTQALEGAKANVDEARQNVYQVRASLGLPSRPEQNGDLAQVPQDLNQTFATVREAQAKLEQAAAQLGVWQSLNLTPNELIAHFYQRDPSGDIDKIYATLERDAPAVKQAQAKLLQAQRNLDDANLNLKYTDVYAEIDGVVTRRNVNPGNNVVAGQSLMAVRSLTETWVDANFKETQLAGLRIGQPVDLDVDMYGGQHRFNGRISGFTFGTGSTLALLPAENATGNFVKVVQRLPVRVELIDYDADNMPLFAGLSVHVTVHINDAPTGPNAGKVLQPFGMPTTRP